MKINYTMEYSNNNMLKLEIEILAKGIVQILEFLYEHSNSDETTNEDIILIEDFKNIFFNFYKNEASTLKANSISGKYFWRKDAPWG